MDLKTVEDSPVIKTGFENMNVINFMKTTFCGKQNCIKKKKFTVEPNITV